MSTRYTRKALETLVNYENEVVPPCDGCVFKMYADGVGCAVRFTPVSGASWQREIYDGRYTPRVAAEKFVSWLLSSSCPHEFAFAVWEFAYEQGIRF